MTAERAASYAEWAADAFETRVRPVIDSLRKEVLPGVDSAAWLETCGPGTTPATRFRLFPGTLFLLWAETLGGPAIVRGAEPVAAAIELLHNASLAHDDVLDGHRLRKGQPTLYATRGSGVAVLGGDALGAAAMIALAHAPADRLAGALRRLGCAAQEVAAGQILDEPQCWCDVPPDDRWEHWLRVCRGKLALGNLGGPMAAFWTGRGTLEEELRLLLSDYSVVSQIINDFGDLLGFAGYQTRSASLRSPGEEASRKPTLPAIWSGKDAPAGDDLQRLLERAEAEISRRKGEALRRLERLPIAAELKDVLLDFFLSPTLLPEEHAS